MSNADRVQVSIAKETTFGVAATGIYQALRVTAESLAASAGYVQSNELDAGRQITGFLRNDFGAGGNLEFELSHGGGATSAFNSILLGLLFQNAFSSPATILTAGAVPVTFTAATRTLSAGGAGFSDVPVVGQWIEIKGSVSNDGFYKIATVLSATFTVVQPLIQEVATTNVGIVMGAQQ